jgi:hypothetical protein
MSTVIEVATIRSPKEGKKMATVVAATGQSFYAFPNVIAALKEGRRYEVDIEETEFNNRPFRKITKAKEVMPTDRRTIAGSETTPDPRPRPGAAAGADQEFVTRMLCAAIKAGVLSLDPAELSRATIKFQMLWSTSFGPGLDTFRASKAAPVN